MGVTIKDVSREAGVAAATVSYVLSGKAAEMKISEATRNAVFEAARRLHYRPNLIAKNLRRRNTRTVGVVFNDLYSSWANQVMQGIDEVLFLNAYQSMIGITYFDPEREHRIINAFLDNQVEALIIQPLQASADFYRELRERTEIPLIFVGESIDQAPAKAFMLDAVAAGRLQIDHLFAQGYRRIAVISSDNASVQSRGRLLGAETRLRELNLEYPAAFRRTTCNMCPEQDIADTLELLRQTPPPDAIAVVNDVIAYRVMSALIREKHPEIAVIGIGDLPESAYEMIGLTSVVEPRERMGRECAVYLLAVLQGKSSPDTEPVLFRGGLAERCSTSGMRNEFFVEGAEK